MRRANMQPINAIMSDKLPSAIETLHEQIISPVNIATGGAVD
ncbi:hypothetical protein SAMN05421690_101057 [Nitrosomonas sp. Nm51]|nr:hypothetical protein SAMN05421690_101057 [Nitrosomonas sp. Nm51]